MSGSAGDTIRNFQIGFGPLYGRQEYVNLIASLFW
jgi:hypothetical protein